MAIVTNPIDRRRFLLAGAGALAAGVVGTAACSTNQANKTTVSDARPVNPSFAVLGNTFDYFSGIDQRIALALATNAGNPIHPNGPVTLQVGPVAGPLDPPVTGVLHGNGLVNPYILSHYTFAAPGTYNVRVSYGGQQADLPITVIRPSDTPIPLAGKPLIDVATPTNAHPLGVNPVCTAQPPCPFHAVSLTEAMAQHQRIALMFATPALCTSRFCGPVLDNLVAVHQAFAAKVTFIHCEIFTDLSGQTGSPPVTAYHLEHEPMLLLAGTDGVVRERIDNASDRTEQTDALNRLMSS